jgi:hypothetical protein
MAPAMPTAGELGGRGILNELPLLRRVGVPVVSLLWAVVLAPADGGGEAADVADAPEGGAADDPAMGTAEAGM